ncbi:hypothetical protein SCHPADRAFT_942228 [Schizopora paradoxa]|uniref:Uncharacterized protein n=1 Tax=Schizopora paradoxa TaxID=27342 RepID=A0A0H2RP38_9AGAM|nr:hypothetical protein SCHPADRAFT_942228 [Schizopora paradoxa]
MYYRFSNSLPEETSSLQKDWPNFCHATALFWWRTDASPTIKIRVQELMKEFADTECYGRHVEGWLFFGDAGDLASDADEPVYYTVNINYEIPKAIRVDFYGSDPDTHTTTPFAKFLCKDTTSSVPSSAVERKGTGIWRTLDVATCPATLFKRRNDNTIDIHAHSIKKKLTFELPSNSTFKDAIHHTGVLQFHNIKDMVHGETGILNFGTDRVAFFNAVNTSKAILFYPSEIHGTLPAGFKSHGVLEGKWYDEN